MERAAKRDLVDALHGVFSSTEVAIVAHYSGLKVAEFQQLRHQMKEVGASLKVSKNRLAMRALEGTDVISIVPLLKGPTVIATAPDPVAACKIAVEFAQANANFRLVGGAMKNFPLDVDAVKQLAKLPSLDELRGTLIGLIIAPASKLARVVNTPAGDLARVIRAASGKPDALAPASAVAQVDRPQAETAKRAAVAGTSPSDEGLTIPKLLPSTIVKSLDSADTYKRIEGIREASRFLREYEVMASLATPLPPSEMFEASTLAARLYDKIFSPDESEARQAAYSLVASVPKFRGELNPDLSPVELSEPQLHEFEEGLLKLFAAMNFRYFSIVEAVKSDGSDGEHLKLHVTVKLSRKVPFLIGKKTVFLKEPQVYDGRLRIGSPLAEVVEDTKTSKSGDSEQGVVAVGETDMTVRIDHIVDHRIPISVAFNRAVARVSVDVSY